MSLNENKKGIILIELGSSSWYCSKCDGARIISESGEVILNTCKCGNYPIIIPRLDANLTERFKELIDEIFCRFESFFESTEESNFFYHFFNMLKQIFGYRNQEKQ